MRKTMPFWEDRDYGYDLFEVRESKSESKYEDMVWQLEYLTEQFLEYARVKQTCLRGYRPEECDAERGGGDCRDCLAIMTATWEPIQFD